MKNYRIFLRLSFTFLALLFLSLNLATAQWYIYDCFGLPGQNTPAFVTKDDYPAEDFSITNIQDPDDPQNFFLQYDHPSIEGKTTFRYDFDNPVSNFTLVTRIKGIPGATAENYFRIMEFDVRGSGVLVGNKFEIRYDDTLKLDRPEAVTKTKLDSLDGWHLYRFTMDGTMFRLYVDENETPILEGVSDRERTDNYFKFGDQSDGYAVGGIIDWIIWNDTVTWAPGEGAEIPSELNTEHVEVSQEPQKPTEIDNNSVSNQIRIFPSVPKSLINIQVPEELISGEVAIVNMLGIKMLEQTINSGDLTLNINNLSSGLYIVILKNESVKFTKRIIVQ